MMMPFIASAVALALFFFFIVSSHVILSKTAYLNVIFPIANRGNAYQRKFPHEIMKIPKTIENISSCEFFSEDGESKKFYMGYDGWLPAEREARKPKQGYNLVKCKHYRQADGKCLLQFFFPTHYSIDYNPCVFAES